MEELKSFHEFINESKNIRTPRTSHDFVYESETGEVKLIVNEGFVQDLQLHIRQTIDLLIKQDIKGSKLDKLIHKNLLTVTTSFKDGETPAETVAKLV